MEDRGMTYAHRLEAMTRAALTGLLADPEDRASECLPGETCAEAVARLAVAQAVAALKAIDRELLVQSAAAELVEEQRG